MHMDAVLSTHSSARLPSPTAGCTFPQWSGLATLRPRSGSAEITQRVFDLSRLLLSPSNTSAYSVSGL